jgi:WhiB family redox-sensing transcriptional regulator
MTTLSAQPRIFNAWLPLWTPAVATPCGQADPETFFAETPQLIDAAKAICQTCAVRKDCLDQAVARREPHGVWGGELFEDGVTVAQKRPRGRPRTHPVLVALPDADDSPAVAQAA